MALTLLLAVVSVISRCPSCAALEGDINGTDKAMSSHQKAAAAGAVEAAPTAGADGGDVAGIDSIHSLAGAFSQMPWVGSNFLAHYWVYSKAMVLILGETAPGPTSMLRAVQSPTEPIELGEQGLSPQAAFTNWMLKTIVAVLFGFFFYRQKHVTGIKRDPEATMQAGHFGCMDDAQVCFCAFCCPALRWADTINMSGVAGNLEFGIFTTFWVLVASFCTMSLLDGLFLFGCTALLLTWYRQKLRAELNMDHGTFPIMCFDFVFAACCTCCFISQEARAVNEMVLVGKLVLVDTARAPAYGAAV